MATATDDYPRWLERLIGGVIGALIALYLFAPAAYPQAFKSETATKTTTTSDPPGYLGITHRVCSLETTTDNQGNPNGFRVRVKLIYETPNHLEWGRVIGMYRPEDEKKAHLDCLKWQKQTFQKIWEAKKKAREAARNDANSPQKPPLKLAALPSHGNP